MKEGDVMNTEAIKKIAIIQELYRLPEAKLDMIKSYMDTILKDNQHPVLKNQSLKGIWKNAEFEKKSNLETDIKKARQNLQDDILKRQI
jgi:hypothetical protein